MVESAAAWGSGNGGAEMIAALFLFLSILTGFVLAELFKPEPLAALTFGLALFGALSSWGAQRRLDRGMVGKGKDAAGDI